VDDKDYPYSKTSGPVNGPRRAVRFVLLGVVLIGLVALYVLSVGPITWLDDHGYLPPAAGQFFVYFYAPLFTAAGYLPALRYCLDWYVSFFE
jgi:hypothetical protein